MSFELSSNAYLKLIDRIKTLSCVLEIDGYDKTFGVVPVYRFIRIGDDGLHIDGSWKIGDLIKIDGHKDLISYERGTSTSISQVIQIDKGEGSTVSMFQVALIDKGESISSLITPSSTFDLLSRKCKIWAGFDGTEFKSDYFVIHRGIIDDIKSGPGYVIFNISHPDKKKRSEIFVRGNASLTSDITSSDTTINVDSTSEFLEPLILPNGSIDQDFECLIRIDDELIKYSSKNAGSFLNVTRGYFGTIASSHSIGSSVQSVYRVKGNVIDISLKILSSGGEDFYLKDISVSSFQNNGHNVVNNGIYFQNIDLVIEHNVKVGDLVYTSLASNSQNNLSAVKILSIDNSFSGTWLVVDSNLSDEITTNAICSIRSKYNVFPDGLGLSNDEIDIDEHELVKQSHLSSFDMDFLIDDGVNGKEFLQSKVYNPSSCYELPRKARASIGIQSPPLPNSKIKILSEDNVINAGKLRLERTINKEFFNSVIYKFDKDIILNKYLSGSVSISSDSLNRIKIGNKSLIIEADGMRSSLNAKSLSQTASNRRLSKYKFGAEFVRGINCLLKDGMEIEVGDTVVLDLKSLKITDTKSGGTRSGEPRFFSVINKSLNLKTGVVTLDVVDSKTNLNVRYGLVAPSSIIHAGIDQRTFIIKSGYFNSSRFGSDEFNKWYNFVGCGVRVSSPDFSTIGYSVLKSVSDNTISLESDLGFVPQSGYFFNFHKYSNSNSNAKLLHAFMSDGTNNFTDGKPPYVMF